MSNDRPIGMSVGPIPAASIARWTDGWDYDDAVIFRTCIRAMDAVYLGEAKQDKPKPPPVEMNPDIFMAKFGK